MKILILDDDIERHRQFQKNFGHHDLTQVSTVEEAIRFLKTNKFDAVFLDHDLGGHSNVKSGGKEPTGYDVALFMKENPQYMPKEVYIHSMNPAGAKNIKQVLPKAVLTPGLWYTNQ